MKRIVIITGVIVFVAFFEGISLADDDRDIELIKRILNGYEANKTKFVTWRCKAEIGSSCQYLGEDRSLEKAKRTAYFVWDKTQEAAKWEVQTQEKTTEKDGKITNFAPKLNYGMIKKDIAYLQSTIMIGKEDELRELTFFPESDHLYAPISEEFNPIDLQKSCVRDVSALLKHWINLWNNSKVKVGSIRREEETVTIEIRSDRTNDKTDDENVVINKYVFDLSKSCNLIKVFYSSALSTDAWEFGYEKVNEIFVLSRINFRYEDKRASRPRISSFAANLSDSVVNIPIDPSEFEIETLGLREGDVVRDKLSNLRYRWEKNLDIPIKDSGSKSASLPGEPVSLIDKALPEMKFLHLSDDPNEIVNQSILLCFCDMNQRPSRHYVEELVKKAEELKTKGVVVALVQAEPMEQKDLDGWVAKYQIPFAVDVLKNQPDKIRFAWGVKALPWLLLTDRQHVVQAEGFTVTELEEKIKGVNPN